MTAYSPSSYIFRFTDSNSLPLSGGKLYTYISGTSTPLATYTDATGSVAAANPIILDSYGQCQIWIGTGTYRFNLTSSTGVQQPDYPIDGIVAPVVASASSASASVLSQLASTSVGQGDSLIGVKSSLIGSLARTQHQKNQDTVYLTDFAGVDLTGTTDSTAGIQACVNAVTGTTNGVWSGGTVNNPSYPTPVNIKVPYGTLTINGTVYCPVGCSFDFDGTVINIAANTNASVFSYNPSFAPAAGWWCYSIPNTVFRGARVIGKYGTPGGTGWNTTTVLWLINRMSYFHAEDCTLLYTQAAILQGDSYLCRFWHVNIYSPVGIIFTLQAGGGTAAGPNDCEFCDAHIEESEVYPTTIFTVTSGSINVHDCYLEACSTFFNLTYPGSTFVYNCEFGVRDSVNWSGSNGSLTVFMVNGSTSTSTTTPNQWLDLTTVNCGFTFAADPSWTAYLMFVADPGVAANAIQTNFTGCEFTNISNASAAGVTLFKLRQAITGTLSGCEFWNASSAVPMTIFDTNWTSINTGSVSMAINGCSFVGQAKAGSDPILFMATNLVGFFNGAVTGNQFLRTTAFQGLYGCSFTGNTFTNPNYAASFIDNATVANRSLITDNVFTGIAPSFGPYLGLVKDNLGVPLGGTVASASAITPTGPVFHVTGTSLISTIQANSYTQITMIPDGIFTTNTGGNIAIASTAVVNKALIFTYDPTLSKWYPSY